jgi:hypothetical protein
MGAPPPRTALSLVRPLTTAVATDRPEFAWTAVPNASSYRISVFDAALNRVADSGSITTTRWRPASPLARGRAYAWQVRAETPAGSVLAPGPDLPEAKFQVIDADLAAPIDRARAEPRPSHLGLAVMAARVGLLDDAENELQALLIDNPGSPIVTDLLRQVRAARGQQ